ncbi:MAG: GNAT family N-acetyltransferase [Maritimibacter sp.]
MNDAALTLTVIETLTDISPAEWDVCARGDTPFTSHRFLLALERSGSVGPGTGWDPRYLIVKDAQGVLAVAPMYVKSHSQGEYVFDHSWADAFARAGGQYYPKLQIAAPFTPVTGRRFLTHPRAEARGMAALVEGMVSIAADNQLSSVHVTFCTEAEATAGAAMGLIHRSGTQYHWDNAQYESFDDFLATLSSRKRKAIRKERAQAQGFGGEINSYTGDALRPEHWDAFWQFYQDTGARKWGTPYLTRGFFDEIQNTMRDDVLLVLAERDGVPVAGALNFLGADCLYGRYWGCIEHHPALHFELCYYQAIDHAIARGLARVEAGAQGDHKLARGYLPVTTHSLHWIGHEGLRRAVAEFAAREAEAVDQDIEILTSMGPFKRG